MAMQLKSTHNVKNESVQGFGRMYPVDSLWNSEFDGCKMENIRKPLTLLQKRTCAAELRVVSRYPPVSRPATLQKGWSASIIWRILNCREALCSDTAETQMCIYDTIHMYVVRVKCGDVYIDIRTAILKIHMYHTCVCVCGICTYILYHCSIHMCVLATLCIIYIYACVCKQLVACSSDPYVCRLQKKTTVLVHILGLSENKVLKPYGFSSSSPF